MGHPLNLPSSSSRDSNLIETFAVEEWTELLVCSKDVVFEPISQEVHYIVRKADRPCVIGGFEISDLLDESLVFEPVGLEAGIGILLHVPFFRLEVIDCVCRQLGQYLTHDRLSFSLHHRPVELIDHIDQFLVLIIDFLNVDAKSVGPGQYRHVPDFA